VRASAVIALTVLHGDRGAALAHVIAAVGGADPLVRLLSAGGVSEHKIPGCLAMTVDLISALAEHALATLVPFVPKLLIARAHLAGRAGSRAKHPVKCARRAGT
jgi:hypothetical protein